MRSTTGSNTRLLTVVSPDGSATYIDDRQPWAEPEATMTADSRLPGSVTAPSLLTSPGGVRIVIDPWLQDNPACPAKWKRVSQAGLILVTHGHFDHIGDVIQTARDTSAPVVAIVELCRWLEAKGLQRLLPMN